MLGIWGSWLLPALLASTLHIGVSTKYNPCNEPGLATRVRQDPLNLNVNRDLNSSHCLKAWLLVPVNPRKVCNSPNVSSVIHCLRCASEIVDFLHWHIGRDSRLLKEVKL